MHNTFLRTLSVLLFAVGALLPFTSSAADTLTIARKVPFEKDIHVPDAVRAECGLEQKVSDYVREAAKGRHQVLVADSVSAKTPGQALDMTITAVLAPGGGPWSGPKSVTVRGTLWDNGKQIGSFTARRHTTGGGGTCGMLARDAKEIGKDIAKWLASPGEDDKLGDAKKSK